MRNCITSSTYCALALSALLLTTASPSFAVDTATRAAARDLGYEGVEAYEAGDYVKASERLERAFEVLQLPSLALWSARALEKNGKLLEASERYLQATRLSTEGAGEEQVQLDAQATAEEERDALRKRIPKVIVNIQGAPAEEVEVTIDGVVVARALYGAGRPSNPGEIEVVATYGERTVSGKVTLEEADEKQITLNFKSVPEPTPIARPTPPKEAAPAAKPAKEPKEKKSIALSVTPEDTGPKTGGGSWQKTAGWIGIGVGGAGMIFGGVTGVLAMGMLDDLEENCPDQTCGPTRKNEQWNYSNLRIMSSAGLIGGAVVAAAGVTLLVTAPKKQSTAYVSPYLGLTSAGIAGAF